jgi:hypothetical protein
MIIQLAKMGMVADCSWLLQNSRFSWGINW